MTGLEIRLKNWWNTRWKVELIVRLIFNGIYAYILLKDCEEIRNALRLNWTAVKGEKWQMRWKLYSYPSSLSSLHALFKERGENLLSGQWKIVIRLWNVTRMRGEVFRWRCVWTETTEIVISVIFTFKIFKFNATKIKWEKINENFGSLNYSASHRRPSL